MATHPSTLAWKIPWTEDPGGPQSMGSLRVGHDWATDLIWSDLIDSYIRIYIYISLSRFHVLAIVNRAAVNMSVHMFFWIMVVSANPAEKAMAPHPSTLAWKIAWTEEPGRLQSMGSLGVRHGWATSLSLFSFMQLEEEMATHSTVLAWRIPGTGEPGGLPSMGSHRVGHDWSDLAGKQ